MIDAILQQVVRLPLPSPRPGRRLRLGQHRSRQRGVSLDFDQIVDYQLGEPVRHINWAATARRSGEWPVVNTFREDQDLTLMLLVDLSASMDFGSQRLTKRELAAEIGASLVYSALCNHDRVGLLTFADRVVEFLPPRHTGAYQRAVPEAILDAPGVPADVSWPLAIDALERRVPQPVLAVVLSDFFTDDTAGMSDALTRLVRRHDPLALVVTDPCESDLPILPGRLVAQDLETGRRKAYPFTRRNQRRARAVRQAWEQELHTLLDRLHIPHLTVAPHRDYVVDLSRALDPRAWRSPR